MRLFIRVFSLLIAVFWALLAVPAFAVGDADGELSRALSAAYGNDFVTAYAAVGRYLEENPDDPEAYLVRGTIGEWEQKLRNLKGDSDRKIMADFERAENLAFHQYDRDPKNLDRATVLGNSYVRLGKKKADEGKWMGAALTVRKSRQHLEKVLEKNPERWDAYLSIGAFHYFAANLPSGAKPFASILGIKGDRVQGTREIARAAENPNLYQIDARYLLQYVYRKERDFAKVLSILQPLAVEFPKNPQIRYEVGIALKDLKKFPEAKTHFKTFIADCERAEKESATCDARYRFLGWRALGQILRAENTTDPAISAYESALALSSHAPSQKDYAQTLFESGMLYETAGKADKAKAAYQTVLGISDKSAKTWREKAAVRLATLP